MPTYDFRGIVLVAVGLHVPNDLVAKQLRDLGSFEDEPSDVS
jgi:hypothetical protein